MTLFEEIAAHAVACAPAECCGAVVGERVLKARNVSRKLGTYVMDGQTARLAEGLGGASYYYHSHVDDSAMPSDPDRVACNTFQTRILIYSVRDEAFHMLLPEPKWDSLRGTKWEKDTKDCLVLVEQYFHLVHGIHIDHFDRPEAFDGKIDPFDGQAEEAGFDKLPDDAPMRVSDVLTVRLGSEAANHVVIVVGVGDEILHRPIDRICRTDDLNLSWRRRVVNRYRHRRLR